MFNPPKLASTNRSGKLVEITFPLKSVKKTLTQNLENIGEIIIVNDTTKMLMKKEVAV